MSDDILKIVESKIAKAFNSKHPVKKGLSGIDDFAYLYLLTSEQSPEWILKHVLEPIDKLRESLSDCNACPWRLVAFAMLFSENKLPEKHKEYKALIDNSRNNIGKIRLEEVESHIAFYREDYPENAWKYSVKLSDSMLEYGLPHSKQIKEVQKPQIKPRKNSDGEQLFLFPKDE